MGNSPPHGSHYTKEFLFYNDPISQTKGQPSKVTSSIHVPSFPELQSVKPQDLATLAQMQISWRQWGVGDTKLQGSGFSEISFGFGKESPMEEAMMEMMEEAPVMEEEPMMEAPEADSEGKGYLFKKDATWQNREFDFSEEQTVSFDSSTVSKIQYTVKRYQQGYVDCCETTITFLDAEGTEVATLKSHNVPEDSLLLQYDTSTYKEEVVALQPTEMIIGAKINQDQKGANCSIQFLVTQQNPAQRKKGVCG